MGGHQQILSSHTTGFFAMPPSVWPRVLSDYTLIQKTSGALPTFAFRTPDVLVPYRHLFSRPANSKNLSKRLVLLRGILESDMKKPVEFLMKLFIIQIGNLAFRCQLQHEPRQIPGIRILDDHSLAFKLHVDLGIY